MLSNATAAAVAVGRKFREHAAAVAVCECNFRESAVCTKTGTYVLSHATAAAVAVRRKFGEICCCCRCECSFRDSAACTKRPGYHTGTLRPVLSCVVELTAVFSVFSLARLL